MSSSTQADLNKSHLNEPLRCGGAGVPRPFQHFEAIDSSLGGSRTHVNLASVRGVNDFKGLKDIRFENVSSQGQNLTLSGLLFSKQPDSNFV